MPTSKHWGDATQYAVSEPTEGERVPIDLVGGGALVVDDSPDADAALAELISAGRPIAKSRDELLDIVRHCRGAHKWEFVGDSRLKLWQDRRGGIWLHSANHGDVQNAVRLSKQEALGLGQKLTELSNTAPKRP